MKTVLFFDLDGTLWDASKEIMDSWNQVLKEENLNPFSYEQIKTFMGLTPEETGEIAFKDKSKEEQMALFMKMFDNEVKYLSQYPGKLYPNEIYVLEKLSKDYDLYIVSNAYKGYIENYLKIDGISELFKDHLCAGDTGKDKAYNISYLKNKIDAKRVIYIGDTLKDQIEANKANVIFIHANYGFGKIDNPKYQINNISELLQIVKNI